MTEQEVLSIYEKVISTSGGGDSGVLNINGIRSILGFLDDDLYYPEMEDKLTHLVYGFCHGHFFMDGNKRIALTLGAYFLFKNGDHWKALIFFKQMEAIVYHVAAAHIDKDLFHEIIESFLKESDYSESLKLRIAEAIGSDDDNNCED